MVASMRRFLNESDVMAYLVMMSNRLLELHRVLKSTGSLYLYCDPVAIKAGAVVIAGDEAEIGITAEDANQNIRAGLKRPTLLY
jgi:DNA modification methylase